MSKHAFFLKSFTITLFLPPPLPHFEKNSTIAPDGGQTFYLSRIVRSPIFELKVVNEKRLPRAGQGLVVVGCLMYWYLRTQSQFIRTEMMRKHYFPLTIKVKVFSLCVGCS